MAATTRDLQARVEDYHSEDSDAEGRGQGVPLESARRSPAASANSTAKRASSDAGKQEAERVNNIDLQSDSGYSSHTAATMSSADSAPSARSPPAAPATAASSSPPSPPTPQPRRPTTSSNDRKHSNSQSSPRKPLQRAPSSTSRRPAARRPAVTENYDRESECNDPDCLTCGPNALSNRSRRAPSSRDSALDVTSYPSDVRSQRSDPVPSSTYTPASPTYHRQPAPYAQGPAVVQPSSTRRRSSSTTGAARPMSFGGEPGQTYWAPAMPVPYTNSPQEHGLPPSYARYQQQMPPSMPPYMMPHPGYYPSGQPTQAPSPYDYPQRPSVINRGSSTGTYQARGPLPGYGPGIPSAGSEPMHHARYPNSLPRAKDALLLRGQEEEEESSGYSQSESEEEEEEPPTRRIMAPPALKKVQKERRPSLRHANTTQALPDRTKERDSRDPRLQRTKTTTGHSRASSSHRPKVVQEPSKARPAESQRPAVKSRVVVEDSRRRRNSYYQPSEKVYEVQPKSHRRESIYCDDEYEVEEQKRSNRSSKVFRDERLAYEAELEQKRRNRTSRVYHDDRNEYNRTSKILRDENSDIDQKRRNRDSKMYNDENHDAILIPERPRRRTNTFSNARPEYVAENRDRRTADAEAYQQRTRGTEAPLNDVVHKAALKKGSRPSSDAASNRSDDRKSRASRAPTTVTNSGGEIRFRVDTSAPLELSFNGNMEGQCIQFQPGEDGMADIVIGNSETIYRNERGSTAGGRKAIAGPPNPRRTTEEASVRSSHSSNSRRQMDREGRRGGDEQSRTIYRRTYLQ